MQSITRVVLLRNVISHQIQQCSILRQASSIQVPANNKNVVPQEYFNPYNGCLASMSQGLSTTAIRGYAKKKKGGSSKAAKPKVQLTKEELNLAVNYDKMVDAMERVLEELKHDFISQLSLRTSSGAMDTLSVNTPDGIFPLIQIAQISQKSPKLFIINASICPQYTVQIKEAIENSGMNLNPQQDGTTFYIPIPSITREHRENLSKNAKSLCDKSKSKLRDTQNRFLKDLRKKKNDFSEDFLFAVQENIQIETSRFSLHAEEMLVHKKSELLGG